jgi:hypothetical protein
LLEFGLPLDHQGAPFTKPQHQYSLLQNRRHQSNWIDAALRGALAAALQTSIIMTLRNDTYTSCKSTYSKFLLEGKKKAIHEAASSLLYLVSITSKSYEVSHCEMQSVVGQLPVIGDIRTHREKK